MLRGLTTLYSGVLAILSGSIIRVAIRDSIQVNTLPLTR